MQISVPLAFVLLASSALAGVEKDMQHLQGQWHCDFVHLKISGKEVTVTFINGAILMGQIAPKYDDYPRWMEYHAFHKPRSAFKLRITKEDRVVKYSMGGSKRQICHRTKAENP
jgi:hypothetical protein